ncbi:fibroblast growth factor-binding protein 1-like [Antennarius striatus]|uniref:fibroblast growth factor-binding protein 1-like n=1 Tax=Antennarius striatus TaxID=241820 RepID=UPI0035B3E7E5
MAFLTNVTILLVLACISHHVMLSSCQKSNGRTGRRVDKKQHKDKPGQAAQPMKGKLVTKDKSECTWTATGEDPVVIGVSCRKGRESFGCQYAGRPTVCPRYASSFKLFWKQMARALRKQENLCRDSKASVRVGLCRGADRDAHFRLQNEPWRSGPPSTPQPTPKPSTSCKSNHRKLSEEHCSTAWRSVCTFLFTMLQVDDC